MPPDRASSSKALGAILPLIAANQPYEAHQKTRTFASRYVKAQQYPTAIDVLFQSARELLKIGQLGSGTDLTVFLIEVYETAEIDVGEESRGQSTPQSFLPYSDIRSGRVTQLIALVGSEGSWRKTMIDKAVM